mmetsp:Transcript_21202/g.43079  ORF Transcript_21202/g.43079 Transcript_21202/m.43079 type:complete len:224 (-) Transcript_21202:819-1490(-)
MCSLCPRHARDASRILQPSHHALHCRLCPSLRQRSASARRARSRGHRASNLKAWSRGTAAGEARSGSAGARGAGGGGDVRAVDEEGGRGEEQPAGVRGSGRAVHDGGRDSGALRARDLDLRHLVPGPTRPRRRGPPLAGCRRRREQVRPQRRRLAPCCSYVPRHVLALDCGAGLVVVLGCPGRRQPVRRALAAPRGSLGLGGAAQRRDALEERGEQTPPPAPR